jgi:hypothetical protein
MVTLGKTTTPLYASDQQMEIYDYFTPSLCYAFKKGISEEFR